ncbi:hypothetical protein H632_c805p0, partial [Helicosporidium sp. ATCC 50920]
MHPLVEHILDIFGTKSLILRRLGYRSTVGADRLYEAFAAYVCEKSLSVASVPCSDEAVSQFLDWFEVEQTTQALAEAQKSGSLSEDEEPIARLDDLCVLESSESEKGEEDRARASSCPGKRASTEGSVWASSDENSPPPQRLKGFDTTFAAKNAAPAFSAASKQLAAALGSSQRARGGLQLSASHVSRSQSPRMASLPLTISASRPRGPRDAFGGAAPPPARQTMDPARLDVLGDAAFANYMEEIVDAALAREDVFVLMPTGGGKSLTYQLPAVLQRGVTIVVTPLLSLMQDQVQTLCLLPSGGVPASYLSSQQSVVEARAVFRELDKAQPTVKLLYVTPEQFVKSQRLKDALGRLHQAVRFSGGALASTAAAAFSLRLPLRFQGLLARLVIDEAHCISAWGHGTCGSQLAKMFSCPAWPRSRPSMRAALATRPDFRPDYKLLGTVRSACFPGVPVTALTATATHNVRKDILSILGMSQTARSFVVSFFRPNLRISVIQKDYTKDPETQMSAYLQSMLEYIGSRPRDTGIVYCLSRDESESVAACISQHTRVSAAHYHAGMPSKERQAVQNAWRSGSTRVVVATIAFGMGIDKA